MKEPVLEGHSLVSVEFDDIYFSREDGVAETRHVFLEGNQIQDRWKNFTNSTFKIGELGFGTGLNFFVTKTEWAKFPNPPNVIFYSLEKFPLSKEILYQMASEFPEMETWSPPLLDAYHQTVFPPSESKVNQNHFEYEITHPSYNAKFILKLSIGDVLDAMAHFEAPIDCFYLDGFAPKKNPEMWSMDVMTNLRKLAGKSASFATFTSAGFVRRNLEEVGFQVKKQSGYGRKREMLIGRLGS